MRSIDKFRIHTQQIAICGGRPGIATIELDRGLPIGAVVGDVVHPCRIGIGAAIGIIPDRGIVGIHRRI
ncbi:hypothetical protein FGG78_26725 [Thioclava sp. BHET1]|nr:hypothetical protein FGG78_26725 [Thioclava sp. BHET1]